MVVVLLVLIAQEVSLFNLNVLSLSAFIIYILLYFHHSMPITSSFISLHLSTVLLLKKLELVLNTYLSSIEDSGFVLVLAVNGFLTSS